MLLDHLAVKTFLFTFFFFFITYKGDKFGQKQCFFCFFFYFLIKMLFLLCMVLHESHNPSENRTSLDV